MMHCLVIFVELLVVNRSVLCEKIVYPKNPGSSEERGPLL